MTVLRSILGPILRPIISGVLSGAKIRTSTTISPSTYVQSDGTNYFQPDGSSLYLIP